jgi:hypothetical protein
VSQGFGAALSVLLSLPILAAWGFTLYDIVRRGDIPIIRKVVYAALVVLVVPAALLYLLSRPTSLVRHRERDRPDWREDLVDVLDARPGDPPVVGRSEEERMAERVRAIAPAPPSVPT